MINLLRNFLQYIDDSPYLFDLLAIMFLGVTIGRWCENKVKFKKISILEKLIAKKVIYPREPISINELINSYEK